MHQRLPVFVLLLTALPVRAEPGDPVAVRAVGRGGAVLESLRGAAVLVRPEGPVGDDRAAGAFDVVCLNGPRTGVSARHEFRPFDLVAVGDDPDRPVGWAAARRATLAAVDADGRAAEPDLIDGHLQVRGIATGAGTAWLIRLDGLRVVHAGTATVRPGEREVAFLNRPDLLLIPVGGALSPEAAAVWVERLRPTQAVVLLAAPSAGPDPDPAVAAVLKALPAGKFPVVRLPGNLTVAARLPVIWPALAPARVLIPTAAAPAPDEPRRRMLAVAAAARAVTWKAVGGRSAGLLDMGNDYGDPSIRRHLEHCIARDVELATRAAARAAPGSMNTVDITPQRAGGRYAARWPGLSADELRGISDRAAGWRAELTAAVPLLPPDPAAPAGGPAEPRKPPAAPAPAVPSLSEIADTMAWTWRHHTVAIRKRLDENR